MPALANPRHELFVKFLVGGASSSEAFIAAGFSKTGAAGAAKRLFDNVAVKQRYQELAAQATVSTLERVILTREWVLNSMRDVAIKCMDPEDFQPASAIRALEMLGREVGVFRDQVDHNFKWNGDLNALSESQKAQLWLSLEAIAFKDNPAGLEAFRAETDVMMRMIEASSEVMPDEKASVTDGAGKDGAVPAVGPVGDSVDTQGLDD